MYIHAYYMYIYIYIQSIIVLPTKAVYLTPYTFEPERIVTTLGLA